MTANISIASLNVGQSAVSKVEAIHGVIADDHHVIALQEVNVTGPSAGRFCQRWRQLGFHCCLGPFDVNSGFHRVAMLSRFPLRALDLPCDYCRPRLLACALQPDPSAPLFMALSCYGFPGDPASTKAMVAQVVHQLICIGDFNLVAADLRELTAAGFCDALDDAFEHIQVLPPTCSGTRRIDFGLAHRLSPIAYAQTEGVSDHDLIAYQFSVGPPATKLGQPLRARPHSLPPDEVSQRWEQVWNPAAFHQHMVAGQLDEAWRELSVAAEHALCDCTHRDCARSAPWAPLPQTVSRPRFRPCEPVHMRRLRRLGRRLAQLARQPEDNQLRHKACVGAIGLDHHYPILAGLSAANIHTFLDSVHTLIRERTAEATAQALQAWTHKVQHSEAAQRRWIKRRIDRAHMLAHAAPTASVVNISNPVHPHTILEQESRRWGELWKCDAVDLAPAHGLLQASVPRPDPPAVKISFTAELLQRATRAMSGTAAGPDEWAPDQFLRLPHAFWECLATLWSSVVAEARIPALVRSTCGALAQG